LKNYCPRKKKSKYVSNLCSETKKMKESSEWVQTTTGLLLSPFHMGIWLAQVRAYTGPILQRNTLAPVVAFPLRWWRDLPGPVPERNQFSQPLMNTFPACSLSQFKLQVKLTAPKVTPVYGYLSHLNRKPQTRYTSIRRWTKTSEWHY
jgi:hypothetical protein